MYRFSIVGIGPGSIDYLLPAAKREVELADVIVGGHRQLELFTYTDLPTFCLDGRFSEVVDFVQKNRDKKRIAVLVSGDPGFYSLMGLIERKFPKDDYTITPGLSSMQIAFSRIKIQWKDANIFSLHGKHLDSMDKYIFSKKPLGILTDYKNTPFSIASYMKKKAAENRKVFIAENLSYPEERIIETDIYTIRKGDTYKICIMIIV